MPQKPLLKPIRAIKTPFNPKTLLIYLFLILIFLLIYVLVFASLLISENFDIFILGDLHGQGIWTANVASYFVVATSSHSIPNSVFVNTYSSGLTKYAWALNQPPLDTGEQYFWVNPINFSFPNAGNFYLYMLGGGGTNTAYYFGFIAHSNHIDFVYSQAVAPYNMIILKENIATSTYHKISTEFNSTDKQFRLKLDTDEWSEWFNFIDTCPAGNIRAIQIKSNYSSAYFDDIGFETTPCGDYESWYSCQNAGCCWYYSQWLQENFCVNCPTGQCGSGYDDCQNCSNEEDCENEDYCYWWQGVCRYGTGQCEFGIGGQELQFCFTQEDCEAAGGYWYDDFCWVVAKPSIVSWEDYYEDYGDYETSSMWISNVASTTSAFLIQVGGFFSAFGNLFDLQEAYQRGKDFGSVIPQARLYLSLLDEFFGNLPIGTFFIFILTFGLIVGIFRLIRNLFQLIKFW